MIARLLCTAILTTAGLANAAEPLGLTEKTEFRAILEKVGNDSPRVLSAQYQAMADHAQQLSNLLSWTPRISAQGTRSLGAGGLTENNVYVGDSAVLQASMNIFKFGADYSNFRHAQKARREDDLGGELAVLDAENKAAQLLFQWIEVQRKIDSQRSLLHSKEQLDQVAQNRFHLGQLPQQEAEKVRLDLNTAKIQLQQSEAEYLDVKSQLEGLIPGSSRLQEWPWLGKAQFPLKRARKRVEDRKNYEKLNLEIDSRGFQAWSSLNTLLPSLDLQATWQTIHLSPLATGREGDWSAALVLTIPLWDQGTGVATNGYWAQYKKAAEQDLETFRREEQARLATLDERTEGLRKTALLALSSNEKAKSLADASLRRFQMGRMSVNDLFLDQSRVYDAQILAQQALHQYHLVLLENCLAADERPSRCF